MTRQGHTRQSTRPHPHLVFQKLAAVLGFNKATPASQQGHTRHSTRPHPPVFKPFPTARGESYPESVPTDGPQKTTDLECQQSVCNRPISSQKCVVFDFLDFSSGCFGFFLVFLWFCSWFPRAPTSTHTHQTTQNQKIITLENRLLIGRLHTQRQPSIDPCRGSVAC